MKIAISFGYDDLVFTEEDALKFLSLMERGEVYKTKYASKEDGGTTHYIYPQDHTQVRNVKILPDELYKMAKLAGNPDKE